MYNCITGILSCHCQLVTWGHHISSCYEHLALLVRARKQKITVINLRLFGFLNVPNREFLERFWQNLAWKLYCVRQPIIWHFLLFFFYSWQSDVKERKFLRWNWQRALTAEIQWPLELSVSKYRIHVICSNKINLSNDSNPSDQRDQSNRSRTSSFVNFIQARILTL